MKAPQKKKKKKERGESDKRAGSNNCGVEGGGKKVHTAEVMALTCGRM
jgi:hypothetical protein